jgi:hypothetical protein
MRIKRAHAIAGILLVGTLVVAGTVAANSRARQTPPSNTPTPREELERGFILGACDGNIAHCNRTFVTRLQNEPDSGSFTFHITNGVVWSPQIATGPTTWDLNNPRGHETGVPSSCLGIVDPSGPWTCTFEPR